MNHYECWSWLAGNVFEFETNNTRVFSPFASIDGLHVEWGWNVKFLTAAWFLNVGHCRAFFYQIMPENF